MLTLAIETSCDETALALLKMQGASAPIIIDEVISSQIKLHQAYGGVVPELAAREHLKNLPLLYDDLLKKTGINATNIQQIVVTQGPGLKGCLLMGKCYAEGLGIALEVPVYAVNHIEAHVLAAHIDNPQLQPPYLVLVVSGGHSEIIQVDKIGLYKVLARTIDDAAGEAFDKSANLLGLSYPGGPELAKLADSVQSSEFQLPKVMVGEKNFSFSGLKTAISLLIKKQGTSELSDKIRAQLAYSIQQAIVTTLVDKLKISMSQSGISKLVVTGGVAANQCLRLAVSQLSDNVYFPAFKHCTDNAGMIGFCHLLRQQAGLAPIAQKSVLARWPIEEVG